MHPSIEISSKDQSRGFRFSLVAAGEKGQCCQSVFAEQALPQQMVLATVCTKGISVSQLLRNVHSFCTQYQ